MPLAALASIPEARGKALLDRIKALETLLPTEMERARAARAQQQGTPSVAALASGSEGARSEGGAGGAAVTPRRSAGGTASSRSAPEGSLLSRVEVLEEAMDTLLSAQVACVEAQRATEAALLAAQGKQQAAPASSCSCCCMM